MQEYKIPSPGKHAKNPFTIQAKNKKTKTLHDDKTNTVEFFKEANFQCMFAV